MGETKKPDDNYNQFADALLAQSLQNCEKSTECTGSPVVTGCRVNLEAVALEQENFG